MRKNDVVTVVLPGNLGKPRPAIIVQSDLFAETGTVVILPLTSTLTDISIFRILIEPSPQNGLRTSSQVMLDKVSNLPRDKVGGVIGQIDNDTATSISRGLALFFGLV